MKQGCPNNKCDYYQKTEYQKKDGHYYRRDDRHHVQRYQCNKCLKKYSYSTFTLEYRQKKRTYNIIVRNELASGVSLRRCARNVKLHRTTIARKLIYLASKARISHEKFLQSIQKNSVTHIQFDDLITSVHTKLKPLAISVVIDAKKRLILGAKVSEIPAFGQIAKISRLKYGRRKNLHRENLDSLIKKLAPLIDNRATFKTDQHQFYPEVINRYFPSAIHEAYKGERASVAGLGELKNKKFDPLFMINHTLAMLRANINRLFRRTWCTSKSAARLQDHIDLFIGYFNEMILEK